MFLKGKSKEENSVKLAIIYYSSTGTNYQMAKWAEAAAIETGANVRVLRVHETAPQEAIDSNPAWKAFMEKSKDVPEVQLSDLEWADALSSVFQRVLVMYLVRSNNSLIRQEVFGLMGNWSIRLRVR